ncbi:hypothetical protein KBY24_15650 [Ruegeria pomeroyi]|uniref:Uncharacterized protein n=2 Tax=Ruegeria TaxID=97050 RepID=A0A9Q3WGL2_9RHOB|nr:MULTISPECIES: hypothetical protein [Ruegeria]MCE8509458.1 hypothetical protein [Ruegeria pomeroyi]MCE8513281.1 hypothetical protein [Ruegeria pomeroyi]MCE8517799.1 hypothetical protein [Ruegeria pomeroyi]MCE8522498.1 hypothetical protein [Ruegeria pomeroyi]MCE8526790.1 hypothetical protein [Ruegeria pomeroyi]
MDERGIGRAPDYTIPALVMLGVNLTWILILVWALWGFGAALLLAALVHHGITRLAVRMR